MKVKKKLDYCLIHGNLVNFPPNRCFFRTFKAFIFDKNLLTTTKTKKLIKYILTKHWRVWFAIGRF